MIEAEKGVIGAILIDCDSISEVYGILPEDAFYDSFCRECYCECLKMFDNGVRVDVIRLAAKLENENRDKQYVLRYLSECTLAVASSVEIKSFAETMLAEHKAKKLKHLVDRVSFMPNEVDDTIRSLIASLETMIGERTEDGKSLRDIVLDRRDDYFTENKKENLKTGFDKLDDVLGGLEGGDVTILAARPSVGKSALATQIIENVAKKGRRVGHFNLEMNENQVYERFVSRLSGISLTRVRRAKQFLGDEKEKFDTANDKLSTYDAMIYTGSKSVRDIKANSRHMKFDLIVIDYLQLIKSDKPYANRASEVGVISKSIKELARELQVPVLLLSQLSRAVEQREDKEPQLSDLRESGDIEQDASNVIFLWNLSEDKRAKGMSIAKNRQGELKKIGIEFDGEHMVFKERQEEFELYKKTTKDRERNREKLEQDNPFNGWG